LTHPRPRSTSAALAVLLLGAVALPAAADDGGAGRPGGARGTVTVTVPELGYSATSDRFLVGPFHSRLRVLANDPGLPDPAALQIVGGTGRRSTVRVPGTARLWVDRGELVVVPLVRREQTLAFDYSARSANGPRILGHVRLQLVHRVVVARDDTTVGRPGQVAVVAVTSNDWRRAGAVAPCPIQVFVRRPAAVDTWPVVLPQPAWQDQPCAPGHRAARSGAGTWRVDGSRVRFTPRVGFRGTARAFYRSAVDRPYDVAVARVSIRVGDDAQVLGRKSSRGGLLPATGATILGLLALAAALIVTGVTVRRAGVTRPGRRTSSPQ
jgi:hypothetical protein